MLNHDKNVDTEKNLRRNAFSLIYEITKHAIRTGDESRVVQQTTILLSTAPARVFRVRLLIYARLGRLLF